MGARRIGSWWIRDGLDGRRREAQGFGDVLSGLPGFAWTEDHGDGDVVAQDFVDAAGSVAALVLASHGSPAGFAVSDGRVTSDDAADFGKSDIELFVSYACGLLEHTQENSVGRWIPAFDRLHYLLGFPSPSYSGGGQDPRGALLAAYAAGLRETFAGAFDLPVREAWAEANELVEGPDVQWAYLRATSPAANTYRERLGAEEPETPATDRSFIVAWGTC